MRQLHGALRLRGDRRRRDDAASAAGGDDRLARVKTEGDIAPEIDMSHQRPAQYVFDSQVQQKVSEIRANEAREKAARAARTSASAA